MSLAVKYPVALLCQALDLARSSYYYRAQVEGEGTLEETLLRLAEEWPTYGYRRLTAQLRRESWEVNSKRVRRLMQHLGVQGKRPVRKRRTTDSTHAFPRYPNLVQGILVTHPDQVWVADITYVRLHSEFVYLAVLMDVFTRGIRGWHLGRNLDGALTLTALRRGLQAGQPEIHHADQGVQYAATTYSDLLRETGVAISMAEVGAAWQNGFAERLMRTIACPLLIVTSPEHSAAEISAAPLAFKRIMVGCDFSSDADFAINYGLSLAQEFQSEIHLIHVLEPAAVSGVWIPEAFSQEVNVNLRDRVIDRLNEHVSDDVHNWCRVKAFCLTGIPFIELANHALANEIDLVVMGIRGHGLVESLLVGSTTERVIRQVTCPVLSVNPV